MVTAAANISRPSESLLDPSQQNDPLRQGDCILVYEDLKAQGNEILRLVKTEKSMESWIKRGAESDAVVEGGTVGIITGVATASLSLPLALPAAVTAGCVYYYGDTISSKVKSGIHGVSQFVQRAVSSQPEPINSNDVVCIEFDQSSSGWGGSFKGSPSVTVGGFKIKLGNGTELPYRFDLNKDPIISKADLLLLFEILFLRVIEHELTPQNCIKVLDGLNELGKRKKGLESYESDKVLSFLPRGSGLVFPFVFLRELCEAKIARDLLKPGNNVHSSN